MEERKNNRPTRPLGQRSELVVKNEQDNASGSHPLMRLSPVSLLEMAAAPSAPPVVPTVLAELKLPSSPSAIMIPGLLHLHGSMAGFCALLQAYLPWLAGFS